MGRPRGGKQESESGETKRSGGPTPRGEATSFYCSFAAGDTHSSPAQSSCDCEMPAECSHSDDYPVISVKSRQWRRSGGGTLPGTWKTETMQTRDRQKHGTKRKLVERQFSSLGEQRRQILGWVGRWATGTKTEAVYKEKVKPPQRRKLITANWNVSNRTTCCLLVFLLNWACTFVKNYSIKQQAKGWMSCTLLRPSDNKLLWKYLQPQDEDSSHKQLNTSQIFTWVPQEMNSCWEKRN